MCGHSCSHVRFQCKAITNSRCRAWPPLRRLPPGVYKGLIPERETNAGPPEAQLGGSLAAECRIPAQGAEMAEIKSDTGTFADQADSAGTYLQSEPVAAGFIEADQIVGRGMDQPEPTRDIRAQRFAAYAERKSRQNVAGQSCYPAARDELCPAGVLKEAGHHREFGLDANHLIGEPRSPAAKRPVLCGSGTDIQVEECRAAAKNAADERRDEEVGARLDTPTAQKQGAEQKDAAERRQRGQGT